MKKVNEMRREYDFSDGERGKFYGKITGVNVVKDGPSKRNRQASNDELEEIRALFLRLWSKAERQEGYSKSEWKKLGKLLNKNNIPVNDPK
ncbi:MAG TPA: hypothetical protein VM934_09585 [Pyrinomonadaceae bacterium]|jgi:hypothetical protein|nr:hypothetical protein [Pyrinomonadaceae bacterium]